MSQVFMVSIGCEAAREAEWIGSENLNLDRLRNYDNARPWVRERLSLEATISSPNGTVHGVQVILFTEDVIVFRICHCMRRAAFQVPLETSGVDVPRAGVGRLRGQRN